MLNRHMSNVNLDFPRCRECGYRLDHLRQFRCPECGCCFDFNDPETYTTQFEDKSRRYLRFHGITVAVFSVIMILCLGSCEATFSVIALSTIPYYLGTRVVFHDNKTWLYIGLVLTVIGVCGGAICCFSDGRDYVWVAFAWIMWISSGAFGVGLIVERVRGFCTRHSW